MQWNRPFYLFISTTIVWTCTVEAACSYNITQDYTSVLMGSMPYANPSGPWEVGYSSDPTQTLAFTRYGQSIVQPDGFHCLQSLDSTWYNHGIPNFCLNTGSFEVNGVKPGQLSLHPYSGPWKFSIIRFNVPADGAYQIDASFFNGHACGDMEASIFKSGSVILAPQSTVTTVTFLGVISAVTGDVIDFAVGPQGGNNYICGTTPIDVSIQDLACGKSKIKYRTPFLVWVVSSKIVPAFMYSR